MHGAGCTIMSENGKPQGHFWTSLPGILTGLAALIGAGAGLITVLVQVGVWGGDTDPPRPSPSPSDTQEPSLPSLTPSTESPSPSPAALPTPARLVTPDGQLVQRGFFSPTGFVVTFGTTMEDIRVAWEDSDGVTVRARATRTADAMDGLITLLRLVDAQPPETSYRIRLARSLGEGDTVEAFLDPLQTTLGSVLETDGTRSLTFQDGQRTVHNVLVTTVISSPGDAGAPVLGPDGALVGMIFGGGQSETLSVRIEDIRVQFPEAF